MNEEKLKYLINKFKEKYVDGFSSENFTTDERYKLLVNDVNGDGLQKIYNDVLAGELVQPIVFCERIHNVLDNAMVPPENNIRIFAQVVNAPGALIGTNFITALSNSNKNEDSCSLIFESFKNFFTLCRDNNVWSNINSFRNNIKTFVQGTLGDDFDQPISRQFVSFFLGTVIPEEYTLYAYTPFHNIANFLGCENIDRGQYLEANTFATELKGELINKDFIPIGRDIDLVDVQGFVYYLGKRDGDGLNEDYAEYIRKENKMKTKLNYVLKFNNQMILQGPPGTSKTFTALQYIAERVVEGYKKNEDFKKFEEFKSKSLDETINNRWEIVQFHPSYSYEDFVQGIVTETNENDQLIFKVKDKIFLELVKRAKDDVDNDYFLIIDEINRGDISKIFGELILTLEYRDMEVKTAYSHSIKEKEATKRIKIPKNLKIIGTMNTADKSIAFIDYALRRRFAFIDFKPMNSLITNEKAKQDFTKINNSIEDDNYKIGHTYFMDKDEDMLKYRWEYEVKPILEEYVEQGIISKIPDGIKLSEQNENT